MPHSNLNYRCLGQVSTLHRLSLESAVLTGPHSSHSSPLLSTSVISHQRVSFVPSSFNFRPLIFQFLSPLLSTSVPLLSAHVRPNPSSLLSTSAISQRFSLKHGPWPNLETTVTAEGRTAFLSLSLSLSRARACVGIHNLEGDTKRLYRLDRRFSREARE